MENTNGAVVYESWWERDDDAVWNEETSEIQSGKIPSNWNACNRLMKENKW